MRSFALLLLAAALIRPAAAQDDLASIQNDADAPRPNIVFILTDDLGWGDLGVFWQNDSGHDKSHATPQLDAIARSGLQMRAHYCPAPVCAPSRASLLTGVHQGNATVRDNQFDKELEDNWTLPRVLRAAGYRTALVGKYGLQGGPKETQQTGTPADWPAYPTKRGFDDYYGYVSHYAGHLHYPNDAWELANDGHRGTPNLWASQTAEDGETVSHEEVSGQLDKCYTTDLFTAKSKQWIIDHHADRPEQPFFLMLCYDTPHAALQIPTVAYPEGGGVDGGVQWTGEPGRMINTAVGTVDSFRHPDYVGRGWTDLEERFATMVRRIDSAVGDLNQTLADLGLAEDTLVILTSDNGPHREAYIDGDGWGDGAYTPQSFQSYGPFDGIKRDCWEGGIRMPTLAWWAGTIPAGGVDATPSQFHDWMATFADLAGTPVPARCDGVSLAPTLTGQGEQAESTVYIEYKNGSKTPGYDDFGDRAGRRRRQMQVLRQGDIKAVRYDIQSASDPFEIYDLDADPTETVDLAAADADLGSRTRDEIDALQSAFQAAALRLRHPNPSAPRPYDDAPIPATADAPADLDAPTVTFAPSSEDGHFTGTLTVPADGRYAISMTTREGGAFLRLHGAHLLDRAYHHTPGSTATTAATLQAGTHPLRLSTKSLDTVTVTAERLD